MAMRTRTVLFLLAALAAVLIACSKEQKTARETPLSPPEASQRAANISKPDTALAGRYFIAARQLTRAAKYDNAIIGFRQAIPLYEKAGDIEWNFFPLS